MVYAILFALSIIIFTFEFTSFITTGCSHIEKYIIFRNIKRNIDKSMPKNWTYEITYITITKKRCFLLAKNDKFNSVAQSIEIKNYRPVSFDEILYGMRIYDKEVDKNILRIHRDVQIENIIN